MQPPWRRRLTVVAGAALVLVLLAAAAVVGVRWWQDRHRTDLERAVAYAPTGTVRFSWTDWAAVRAELKSEVDAGSSPDEVESFLSDGYDADLTSGSAMVESASLLQEKYGFSPADVDWELLGQSTTGSVMILGLPDDLDTDELGDTFASLGYDRPDDDTGVWSGGEELLARIGADGTLSPQFQYLAIDADRHLLLASDSAPYLRGAVGGLERRARRRGARRRRGGDRRAALGRGLRRRLRLQVAGDGPGRRGRPEHRRPARDRGRRGGPVGRLRAGRRAGREAAGRDGLRERRPGPPQRRHAGRGWRPVPHPGRAATSPTGSTSARSAADGRVVTMRLAPVEGSAVLSDLSNGPVLFATC